MRPSQVRTIEVMAPSRRGELLILAAVSIAILAGVWIHLVTTTGDGVQGGAARRSALLPYQALAFDLPTADQRMFRSLQEGLLEAERTRSTSGRWPEVASLVAEGIPPFAYDPTVKGPTYTWRLIQQGATVNYLGIAEGATAPAWLLLIQEPQPGAPAGPILEDEEHHRLPDGTMLIVSIWIRRDGKGVAPKLIPVPQLTGWIQLFGRAPQVVAGPRTP